MRVKRFSRADYHWMQPEDFHVRRLHKIQMLGSDVAHPLHRKPGDRAGEF